MKTYQVAKLTEARLRKGWTKSELAKRIGVTAPVVARVESGDNKSPKTIKRMAEELGVQMERLVL